MKKEPVVMQVYPWLVGEIFVVFFVRIDVPYIYNIIISLFTMLGNISQGLPIPPNAYAK